MLNKILWVSALLGFLMTTGAQAQAPDVLNPPTKTTVKKKAKKPKAQAGEKGSKATFVSGSQETKKERTARLMRECKGQTNAGACSGYTR
ncbi:MAG: hypothetical protein HQ446_05665 [Polaromonas sp.]|nr:hypothetical protein [Polaromonas sp.]